MNPPSSAILESQPTPHVEKSKSQGDEKRRNMSPRCCEFAEGRMKPECHSAKFGLGRRSQGRKPESARMEAE